jgi:hypothetical protein
MEMFVNWTENEIMITNTNCLIIFIKFQIIELLITNTKNQWAYVQQNQMRTIQRILKSK